MSHFAVVVHAYRSVKHYPGGARGSRIGPSQHATGQKTSVRRASSGDSAAPASTAGESATATTVATAAWTTVATAPSFAAKREAVVDSKSGAVIGQRWTYPAVCRIDGDVLTLVWWLNHQLLEKPPEDRRPKMLAGLPNAVLAGLREGKPLLCDDPRVEIPNGVGCFICQRYSSEPHDIPDEPPVAARCPSPPSNCCERRLKSAARGGRKEQRWRWGASTPG